MKVSIVGGPRIYLYLADAFPAVPAVRWTIYDICLIKKAVRHCLACWLLFTRNSKSPDPRVELKEMQFAGTTVATWSILVQRSPHAAKPRGEGPG